jgi:hypothetical protein
MLVIADNLFQLINELGRRLCGILHFFNFLKNPFSAIELRNMRLYSVSDLFAFVFIL